MGVRPLDGRYFWQVEGEWVDFHDQGLVDTEAIGVSMCEDARIGKAWNFLEEVPQPNAWRPIETAPKDGTHILIKVEGFVIEAWWEIDPDGDAWRVAWIGVHGCGCCGGGHENTKPTHWMLMPEPPV
jgi:hypothetical protein